MTHDEWLSVLGSKVQGTWNLHKVLASHNLDFFVCFGSLAGLCGNAGQANYAAANSFLDAFVQYRRGKGLIASVIDLGLMDDAGFAYEHAPKLIQRAQSASMQTVAEHELVQALELAITKPVQIALGLGTTKPLSISGVVPPWTRDARYNLWTRIIPESETDTLGLDGDLRELMESIRNNPEILDDAATERRVTKVLGREIGSHLANTDDMDEDEICKMVIESLAMIEIRSWYRRHLNLELPLVEISNAETIGGLGKATMQALRMKYQGGNPEIASTIRPSAESSTQYLQDAALGRAIQPLQEPVPEWYAESEGHVVLTGATGFVGAFFLSMLAALPQVKTVTCLVRAPDATAAMNRLEATFAKLGLSKICRDKVQAVPGDLTQRNLGLENAQFTHLSKQCSAIFHLGAVVNYTMPYSAHRHVNVLGLVGILEFANTHRLKSVHYFSGMAAYGPSGFLNGQTYVPENEKPVAGSGLLQHHMGYSLSKFVGESICWDAISNGFPLSIYRPGFVLGHSITGMGNADDAVNRLMSTCISLGAYPVPPNQPNCFVPVDFVCSAALEISMSNENIGQAYNLIHPNADENIDLSTTFEIIGQLTSPPLRCVQFADWVKLMSQAKGHRLSEIAPIVAERLAEGAIWWNGKQDAVVLHGTENVHRALAQRPDILNCETMLGLLKKYFNSWSQLAEANLWTEGRSKM
jgi:thioester reductase-like protein